MTLQPGLREVLALLDYSRTVGWLAVRLGRSNDAIRDRLARLRDLGLVDRLAPESNGSYRWRSRGGVTHTPDSWRAPRRDAAARRSA